MNLLTCMITFLLFCYFLTPEASSLFFGEDIEDIICLSSSILFSSSPSSSFRRIRFCWWSRTLAVLMRDEASLKAPGRYSMKFYLTDYLFLMSMLPLRFLTVWDICELPPTPWKRSLAELNLSCEVMSRLGFDPLVVILRRPPFGRDEEMRWASFELWKRAAEEVLLVAFVKGLTSCYYIL